MISCSMLAKGLNPSAFKFCTCNLCNISILLFLLRHNATKCKPNVADSCAPMSKLTPSLTHGEVYTVATCHVCSCHDGFVNCTKTDVTRDCPDLTCPQDQRVTEEGTCCPVCRGETRNLFEHAMYFMTLFLRTRLLWTGSRLSSSGRV